MTPTQYVKTLKPYYRESNPIPEKTFMDLDAAWKTFTPTQRSFIGMTMGSMGSAIKAIRKQKRNGTN
jgi:hypothetical protein